MVKYRSFLNDDPPGLAEIWNEAFTGRGAAQLRNSSPLERYFRDVRTGLGQPPMDDAALTLIGKAALGRVQDEHLRRCGHWRSLRHEPSLLPERFVRPTYQSVGFLHAHADHRYPGAPR